MRWDDIVPLSPQIPNIGFAAPLPGPMDFVPSLLRFGVVGSPISHSLSPKMQTAAFEACGILVEYLPLEAAVGEFEDALSHLELCGFTGANITVPHKQHPMLFVLGDSVVKQTGAANTLRFIDGRIEAINTDPQGFSAPIQALRQGKALVLGAGGAAAAAVFALRSKGWEVAIWNRSPAKAQSLAAKWMCEHRDEPDPAGCSLVVNATSLGLHVGEEPTLEWRRLEAGATVYDLAYRQGPTDFLSHALLEGARTVDGREMLVAQGAVSFHWWTRRNPPVEVMRKAVGL